MQKELAGRGTRHTSKEDTWPPALESEISVHITWPGLPWQGPQPGWLQQHIFIYSWFWKSEVQDQGVGGLVSSEASLFGLKMDIFMFMWHSPSLCFLSKLHFLIRILVILDYWPVLWPHFNLIISWKTLSPNTVTVLSIGSYSFTIHLWRMGLNAIMLTGT
jgi:hypothetical protein